MFRFNVRGGQTLNIPEVEPLLIQGCLITNPSAPTEDAILTIVDAHGDVLTANGMRLSLDADYGGMNIDIRVDPPITISLIGKGAAATIYYERLRWGRV